MAFTLNDATTASAPPLLKTPFEVLQMIFGLLNFPDLRAMILVSKSIYVSSRLDCTFLICSLLFSRQATRVNSISFKNIILVCCPGFSATCRPIACSIGRCMTFYALSRTNFVMMYNPLPFLFLSTEPLVWELRMVHFVVLPSTKEIV